MATPSLAMIPSAYADSKLYSVIPNNGDGDFTFNRDSAGTRIGSNGLIQTVGFFGNNLIINGDFSTDSDWVKGTGWSIGGGVAVCNGTQTGSTTLRQDGTYTNGVKYKITYTITVTAGTVEVRFQGGGSTVIDRVFSINRKHKY
jgi:hypothetical protein